jgi:DNA uptake protein ComE-like DNA-binding protein
MVRKSIRILAALFAFGLFASMALAQSGDTATPAKTTKTKSTKTPKSQLVDINAATKAELDAIFTGGDTSQKVIAGRPYNTKRDLVTKQIITEDEYKKVSDKIIAHRVGGAAGKKKADSK